MVIKETSFFTKRVQRLLDKDSYRLLQLRLVADPDAGALIQGTGGLRKIRWEGSGRGKRGGVRIIYYYWTTEGAIYLLTIYAKSEKADLSTADKKALRKIVESLERDHG